MTEWLYEAGIGEARAALVDRGRIVEALVDRPDEGPKAGAVVEARLTHVLPHRRRGIATLPDGAQLLVEPLPQGVTEGARFHAAIVREAIAESGRAKLPKAISSEDAPRPAPDLLDRVRATGLPVRILTAHGPDLLEEAGWSELLEEATRGEIAFPGGQLRISLAPAMTLIDVDGDLAPADLAQAGAAAAGVAIRRLGLGGSIGVDLPTARGKAERQAAAQALDDALPPPFERTAVNGFGFMQIIRPRPRASLPELLGADPVKASALQLLRRAERTPGAGLLTLSAHPAVIERIAARQDWLGVLEMRTGAKVRLAEASGRPISAGDANREHPR